MLAMAACIELPPRPAPRDGAIAPDAGDTPAILDLTVFDAAGAEWSPDQVPRSPRIVITASKPLTKEPPFAFLFAGDADEGLVADLASAPLRASTAARQIECHVTIDGTMIELSPTTPLAAGARLVVAIAGWARDDGAHRIQAPFTQALTVANDARAGARAIETWPADGATSIGPALSMVGVRFDGRITGLTSGLWLEESSGQRVPGRARSASCDEVGWEGDHCAIFALSGSLGAAMVYVLRSSGDLRDATGAAVPAISASFMTSRDPDEEPPRFLAIPCAIDELATESGCVFADDTRIAIRVRATEPVRLRLELGGRSVRAVAPRGEATLEVSSLRPDTLFETRLVAIDAVGHERVSPLALQTMPPLPLLSITEVRADPAGAEPRQEYVEIWNAGAESLDLEGFAISDSPSTRGDVIAGSHRLAPGVRALLVASDFDADDRGPGHRDTAVPPGVMLIRLDRSLGSGGLSNAGEPLFLRDPNGRRISAAPAEPAPRSAVCIARIVSDLRTGARATFDYDAANGCTPGR